MPQKRTTPVTGRALCPTCGEVHYRQSGQAGFCRRLWFAAALARNRAFVTEVNARTVCAHCGAQPIEWHNPEHVELNRQSYRISNMVRAGFTIAAIQTEMDRCTPLCILCHRIEDGRMARLIGISQAREVNIHPPRICNECGGAYGHRRGNRGLCSACYQRWLRREKKRRAAGAAG